MKAPTFHSTLLAALLLVPAPSLLAQKPAPEARVEAENPAGDSSDDADSITREIEQRVLLKQCQAASEALVELAQAAGDTADPAEIKRIEAAVTRNAAWLARLQQDLRKSGADMDDVEDDLNTCAGTLNEAAWQMLTSGDEDAASHPQLALQLSTTAVGLLSAEDPEQRPRFLDTRARALFMTGQHDQALIVEQQALAACEEDDESLKAQLQSAIAAYQKGELPAADPGSISENDISGEIDSNPDPSELNKIAWKLLTDENTAARNPAAALQLGTIALGLCSEDNGPVAEILDTCARALFTLGKPEEALTLQKKAVALCKDGDGNLGEELQSTLASYEAGKIPAPNQTDSLSESDAGFLNEAAWNLLIAEEAKLRNPDMALKLATVAVDLCAGDATLRSQAIDTRARALFLLDRRDEAITAEQAAIAAAADNAGLKQKYRNFLAAYMKGELPNIDDSDTGDLIDH